MAQDFESNGAQITNSNTTIFTSNSDDAVVGLRLANILTTAVTVSIFVSEGGSTTRYLVKDLSIPPASSVELIRGGAKVVLQNGDVLNTMSDNTIINEWIGSYPRTSLNEGIKTFVNWFKNYYK